MKPFKKILVATDTRYEEHPIVEKAAEFAVFNEASLKIVDVAPEVPWLARITMKDNHYMQDLVERKKLEKLEVLAEPIRQQGINVETAVLTGKSSVELVREVLRNDHDLVVSVSKGKDSQESSFFGQTAKRLLRKCPCAVWLVTSDAAPDFKHVLGCLDTSSDEPADSELNQKVFDLGTSISKFFQGRLSLVHAWSVWNEPMLRSHLPPDEFEQQVRDSRNQVEARLNEFMKLQGSDAKADNVHLVKGEARHVIPRFVREFNVDLVVMGTVARSGLTGMVMGNTAEHILNRLECSVMALKPAGFVSPIRISEDDAIRKVH